MNPRTTGPNEAFDDGSNCEDEFFGSQEEHNGNGNDCDYDDDDEQQQQQPCQSFGNMGKHDQRAKHHELKTAGFLDAFDESKEEQLQEGFEAGFLESFGAGRTIGKLLGRASTTASLFAVSSMTEDQPFSSRTTIAAATEASTMGSTTTTSTITTSTITTSSTTPTTTITTTTPTTTITTASRRASELVHKFFANEFQTNRDPDTVRDDLDRLVAKTRSFLVEAE
jgi:hypothetical protein